MSSTQLQCVGDTVAGMDRVLTPPALDFLTEMLRAFEPTRRALLARRRDVRERLKGGALPRFLPETEEVRSAPWRVAPSPPDLTDRRVEINGPVERKMMINAINSGASCFMADF